MKVRSITDIVLLGRDRGGRNKEQLLITFRIELQSAFCDLFRSFKLVREKKIMRGEQIKKFH